MTDASQLLRDYTENGSEAAFRELVARYVNLVYSVAVRRASDDPHLAEDIVQTVFTDLARKGRTLRHESMLGGWLHRHTCFVSSTLMRGERRRQERERQAMEMNTLLHSGDSSWEEIAPVLDEAINKLDEADRRAVLLRFFEQRDLRTIGAALGTNEDAAQKRVSRALDKLRALLAQRGVALSVAALAAVCGSRAVLAAPAGLAGRVSNAALAAASAGYLAILLKWMTPAKIAIALAVAVTAVLITPSAWHHHGWHTGGRASPALSEVVANSPVPASAQAAYQSQVSSGLNAAAADPKPARSGVLRLTIVAADSGKPVPNVPIDYRGREGNRFAGKKLAANRDGVCEVGFPADTTTDLQLTTRIDGFADTRLHWRPDRGEKIPSSYTLRLIRPVLVGGTVVDSDDRPVAGAKVGFNVDDDPTLDSQPEDHKFSWIEVTTDTNGRWGINRVAPEIIHRLRGSARHREYVDSQYLFVSQDKSAEEQLRQRSHVFKLGRPVIARGTVVDSDEMPVRDAKVRVGHVGESGRRQATSELDGSFVVRGCRPGNNLLSAEAQGFSTTTLEINLSEDSEPFQIKLQRGRVLRLRIVNQSGEPIPNAGVWLDTLARNPLDANLEPVQAEFNGKTGSDGRLIWESAPEADLLFGISASGYMRVDSVKVHPDVEEHVVTLPSAVTIAGTVRDDLTGALIPKFRIITGWPSKQFVNGVMTNVAQWSTLDRFWMSFSGGEYRHTFEEPVVGGVADPSYIFKFEAEGYAPFVSRTVRPDEGEARLDVTLRKAESSMITALLPEGSPAVGADVGLVWPGAQLQLVPGGFARNNVQDLAALLETDSVGRFRLASNDAILRVIVANAKGFAETTPTALSANPIIRLQPWGRLEGTYLSGGKPARDRSLALEYGGGDFSTVSSGSGFKAQSDAHGHFVFPQAPPGRHRLMRVITLSSNSWTSEQMTEVEIRPDETTTVTLGASNCTVAVQLRWPDGMKRQANWSVFASLHSTFPQPPAETANDAQALAGWRQTPEFRALAAHARHYRLTEDAAGLWSAEDVAPGNYALTVNVAEMPSAGGPGSNLAHAHATVTVSADSAGQLLDLGEIVLQPGQ